MEDISSLSIASYPKYNNREHRILHRAYNRYKAKKEQQEREQEFELAPPSVVNTWDKDKQTKWFTAQMNRGARNVLPALASVAALPWVIQGAVAAPLVTALGIVGGYTGSKIGGYYGRKIDTRRHGLSDAELVGSVVGGALGGTFGSIAGNGVQNQIISNWLKRPLYKNNWATNGTPRLHYFEEMTLPNTPINTNYQNWFNRTVSGKNVKKLARAFTKSINSTLDDDIMNYSNYKFLDRIVKSGDYVTQLISKTKNPEVNSPIHTYNTISAHFTPEGLAPGSWSGHIWTNRGNGYFVKLPTITGELNPIPPKSNWTRVYPKLELKPMPRHITVVFDDSMNDVVGSDLWGRTASNIGTFNSVIPNGKMKHILEYDPLLKTFFKWKRD